MITKLKKGRGCIIKCVKRKAKTTLPRDRKFAEDFPVGTRIRWRKPLWLSGNNQHVPPSTGHVTGHIAGAALVRLDFNCNLITVAPKQECEAI